MTTTDTISFILHTDAGRVAVEEPRIHADSAALAIESLLEDYPTRDRRDMLVNAIQAALSGAGAPEAAIGSIHSLLRMVPTIPRHAHGGFRCALVGRSGPDLLCCTFDTVEDLEAEEHTILATHIHNRADALVAAE